jgi:glycosyltransferase involved in cell wall biosynthesis
MNKVLYICTESSPGMIPFASSIINTMSKSDYKIYVLYLCDKNDEYKYYLTSKAIIYKKNIPQRKSERILFKIYPIDLLNMIELICKENCIKVIHLLTIDYILTWLLPKLVKSYKLIYTVHDLFPHDSSKKSLKKKLFDIYINCATKRNIRKSQVLVTSSRFQFKILKRNFANRKKVMFHNFPTLITTPIKEGNKVCPELLDIKNYILFFGNIDVYKGVEYLYNAFINSDLYKYQTLVIAGKGNIYFSRDKSKEQNLIYINRYIMDDELKSLYKNAKCVIYPYISATQSGVLSLAYYFQTCLIASDAPFFKENIVNMKTGILYKKQNVEELYKAISIIFNGIIDLDKMKEEQLELYKSYFDEERLKNELVNIYS